MIHGKVKLGIAIPSGGMWENEFGMSLALMLMKLLTEPPAEYFQLHITNRTGSVLPANRTFLAKDLVLEHGCTHILWLDDDMTFPPDTAHRLLKSNKSIIGCNASRKNPPYAPTAIGLDKQHCYTTQAKTGLEEVIHVGMAVMLTDARIFKQLKEPWFPMQWSEERQDYIGEDVYFCHLMRSRGLKIWVDHALSREITHVGTCGYTLDLSDMIVNDPAGSDVAD